MIIIAVILMFVPLYGTCFMSWATFKIFPFIKSLINLIIMYYFGIISSCFLCIVSQFTHMHEADLYPPEYSRETLCIALELSLYAALCFLVLCLVNSSLLGLSELSALSPQLREVSGVSSLYVVWKLIGAMVQLTPLFSISQ